MSTSQIQIRLPTPSEQNSPHFITHITNLINSAYASTDSNLYKPNVLRTNTTEVHSWLASNQFYLAFARNEVYPIGTVQIKKVSPSVSDVGILTVRSDARVSGLGRRLMAHAEEVAVKEGSGTVRLEMLVEKETGVHDVKGYLRRWYGSLGYVAMGTVSVEEVVPQIKGNFEEGAEFLVMEKVL
jgi:GNAT superfamily N-acetyltransferase